MAEGFKDPKVREAKTREVLPYNELPAGYYPAGAMSIPFLMDFAILTDRSPPPAQGPRPGEFDERSFIFMNMRHLRDNREKMERYLRGEAPAPEDSGLEQVERQLPDAKELIRRGPWRSAARPSSTRPAAARSPTRTATGTQEEGIVTMVLPECPDDRLRFGIWIGPDRKPGSPRRGDYTGTPADPAAMQEFLGNFRLCGGVAK